MKNHIKKKTNEKREFNHECSLITDSELVILESDQVYISLYLSSSFIHMTQLTSIEIIKYFQDNIQEKLASILISSNQSSNIRT